MICVVVFVATKIGLCSLLYWKWSRTKNICEVRVSGQFPQLPGAKDFIQMCLTSG